MAQATKDRITKTDVSPFDRFQQTLKRLLKVSKEELDEAVKNEKGKGADDTNSGKHG